MLFVYFNKYIYTIIYFKLSSTLIHQMGICVCLNNKTNVSVPSFRKQSFIENNRKETLFSNEVSSKNQNNTNMSTSFNTDTQNQSLDVSEFLAKSQPNKPKIKLIIKYTHNPNPIQSHSFISDSKITELASFTTGVKSVQSFQSLIKHKNTNHKTVMLQPRVEGIVRNRNVLPHYINEEYAMKDKNNNHQNGIEQTILPKRQTTLFGRKESLLAIDEFIERMK